MKLTVVIFIAWIAQSPGTVSTQSTPVSSTAVSAASTTPGSTVSVLTVSTTSSNIGTSGAGSNSVQTTHSGTTGSTASGSTGGATVTTTPSVPDCTPIDAPAPLRIDGESPCTATKLNNQTIQFKSPNFPKNYPNSVVCKAETSSVGPRSLEITPKLFTVHQSDKLIIKGPFGYKKRIQNADLNNSIRLPSTYATFEFTSSKKKNMKGFKVNIKSRTNSCQRICSLLNGSTGYIRNGVYGADTYCEWWMQAPTGCYIEMMFEKFNVGPASTKGGAWSCEGDYVGVDRSGDPGYNRPNSNTFCGSALPSAIRSVDNKINVLFNGRDGGFNGFDIKYNVVC